MFEEVDRRFMGIVKEAIYKTRTLLYLVSAAGSQRVEFSPEVLYKRSPQSKIANINKLQQLLGQVIDV